MLRREVLPPPASRAPMAVALGLISGGLTLVFLSALAMALSACAEVKQGAGEVGGDVLELVACPTSLIDCGWVYMCEQTADNPLGHIEICVNTDDDPDALAAAEQMFGQCEPTPRHQGLCAWHCDGGPGCNAFNSCWGCP